MKYSERDELVKGLRELADFLDSPRGMQLPITYPTIRLTEYLYGENDVQRANLQRAARALGKADKDFTGASLKIKRQFSENVSVEISGNREAVCVARPVGTRVIPAYSAPERTETVYEYICTDPLLADAKVS